MFRIKKLGKTGTGIGFVLIALLEVAAQSGDGYLVRGRAVDGNGKGVQGVSVCVEPVLPVYTSDIVQCVGTKSDGAFEKLISERRVEDHQGRFSVYVSETRPEGISLIDAPYGWIRKVVPEFLGQEITLLKSVTDVGDVQVRYRFGVLLVQMGDFAKIEPAQWKHFYFRVRNKSGDAVEFKGMSREGFGKFVDPKSRTLRFTIPEGTWTLDLIAPNGEPISDPLGSTPEFTASAGKVTQVRFSKLAP